MAAGAPRRSFLDESWGGGGGGVAHTPLHRLSRRAGHGARRSRAPHVVEDDFTLAATGFIRSGSVSGVTSLEIAGPPGSSIYIDDVFRGKIRPAGNLRIEPLPNWETRISADLPDGSIAGGTVTLKGGVNRVN